MKKNFFKKKLASGLALALVVASLSPAGVSAATATKIVKQGGAAAPTVLYVGNKGTDYSLSKTYKTNTYSWKISNSKLATINAKTGVVTPKAPGTVTIKVTARNAKTNKWLKDFSMKLYIKQRATSIDIGSDDFTLGAGEKKDLNAVKTPKTSTDVVVYASSDEKIAKVDPKTGVVTGVAPGEATITVYAKGLNSSAITSKYNRTDSVKVTVATGISEVKQTVVNKLELTFNTTLEKIATTDLSIVNDVTKQVIAIKEAKIDGKVVTVETFSDMADGNKYTITYDKKDTQFTATDGVVADVTFSKSTIAFDTATEIKVSTVDSKGVVLASYPYGSVTDSKLDFAIETTKGYTNGSKLVLFQIGDTAKLTATYHTYKYDTNGNEIGAIKKEATLTAVDKTAVNVSKYAYTVSKDQPDWDKLTTNTKIAIEDKDQKLWLKVTKSDDSTAAVDEYTFDSSNKNVLLVSNDGVNLAANLVAVSEGSAYVLVKNKDGKVVWSLPVNIVAKRKASALLLDKESVTLSNSVSANDSTTVALTVKDQYGDNMDLTKLDSATVSLVNTNADATVPKSLTVTDGKVSVSGLNGVSITAGTYQYKITLGSLTRTFVVVIQKPDVKAAPTYKLVLSDNSVDLKFDGSSTSDKLVTVKVAVLRGGVVDGYIDATKTNYEVVKGSTVVATNSAVSGDALTFEALTVDGSHTVAKAETGSYTVKATFDGINGEPAKLTLTGGFVLTDSQAGIVATQQKDNAKGLSVEAAIADAYKFSYEGKTITVSASDITKVDSTDLNNSTFVRTAYVNAPIVKDGTTYKVPVKVTFNATIVR